MESVNFDRAAGYYDATRALPGEAMSELLRVLLAELSPAGRQRCLEIGVGTGRIALPLHEQGIEMAGADISEAMLRRLIVNAEGMVPFPVLRADATALPLADGSVGSVLAVHVLHLIPGWQRAVDEAVRVLRPGGVLLASSPGGGRPSHREADPPPWRAALEEARTRHGVVRVPIGARTVEEITGYLGGRATARLLPQVPVRQHESLGAVLHGLEEQLYSWSWPYSREQVRAVAADVRAWAVGAGFPLDEEHPVEGDLEWWAFELAG